MRILIGENWVVWIWAFNNPQSSEPLRPLIPTVRTSAFALISGVFDGDYDEASQASCSNADQRSRSLPSDVMFGPCAIIAAWKGCFWSAYWGFWQIAEMNATRTTHKTAYWFSSLQAKQCSISLSRSSLLILSCLELSGCFVHIHSQVRCHRALILYGAHYAPSSKVFHFLVHLMRLHNRSEFL